MKFPKLLSPYCVPQKLLRKYIASLLLLMLMVPLSIKKEKTNDKGICNDTSLLLYIFLLKFILFSSDGVNQVFQFISRHWFEIHLMNFKISKVFGLSIELKFH